MGDVPRAGFIGSVVGGAEQLVRSAISLVLPVTVDGADVFIGRETGGINI